MVTRNKNANREEEMPTFFHLFNLYNTMKVDLLQVFKSLFILKRFLI